MSALEPFGEKLAQLGLKQADAAVALLWFADRAEPGKESTAAALAQLLHDLRLAGSVNTSRLAEQLRRNRATVTGRERGTFRIAAAAKASLDEKFEPMLRTRRVAITDEVLPVGLLQGTRKTLEDLGREINGCYQFEFYDGCAVMCRRLVEGLLIEVFESNGQRGLIERGGELMMLEGILGVLKSGQGPRLGRGKNVVVESIKDVADRAAHDRYYITQRTDIDEFKPRFRALVVELLQRAKLTK